MTIFAYFGISTRAYQRNKNDRTHSPYLYRLTFYVECVHITDLWARKRSRRVGSVARGKEIKKCEEFVAA